MKKRIEGIGAIRTCVQWKINGFLLPATLPTDIKQFAKLHLPAEYESEMF